MKSFLTLTAVLSVGASVMAEPPPTSPVPGSVPVTVNPGQTQPVVNVGRSGAGVVNPGRADVGRIVSPAQVGVVNPGQAASRLNSPGRLDLEAQRALPGQLSPGQNDGFMLSPGQMDGREVHPGQVGSEVVNPGRGVPALTVDPGQESGAVASRPTPTVFVVGMPAGTTESKVRIANVQKRLEVTNPAMARRIADVQQLPADQQNEALYAVIDEMSRTQSSSAASARTPIAASSASAGKSDTPARAIWVTGTPLKVTTSDAAKQ